MKNVFAEVITIGDELLYGQTLDTNTQWMGQELNRIGVKIIRKTSIGDRREDIVSALDQASARADIMLITGGLGPTKDDITKITLAEYFNSPIVIHPQALADLKALFAQRNYPLTALNEQQAALPEKCTMVPNTMGTAPGMWFEASRKGVRVYARSALRNEDDDDPNGAAPFAGNLRLAGDLSSDDSYGRHRGVVVGRKN